jgi:hypothetical protein
LNSLGLALIKCDELGGEMLPMVPLIYSILEKILWISLVLIEFS